MFCPLCKAEYRQGFSTCSDCHVPLVSTQEEAKSVEVDVLWDGVERDQFESVLAALSDAGIPFHPKETVRPRFKLKLSSIPLRLKSSFQYEVSVFRSDFAAAKLKIAGLFDEPDLDPLD
jgi:hypothetical protein